MGCLNCEECCCLSSCDFLACLEGSLPYLREVNACLWTVLVAPTLFDCLVGCYLVGLFLVCVATLLDCSLDCCVGCYLIGRFLVWVAALVNYSLECWVGHYLVGLFLGLFCVRILMVIIDL